MAYFPDVSTYSNGDRLDADTMNKPIGQLEARTAWLKDRLDTVVGGKGLSSVRLPDVEFGADPSGRMPEACDVVCLDRKDNIFKKALAGVLIESNPYEIGDGLSHAVGIVVQSHSNASSTTGTVALYGLVEFNAAGGNTEAGRLAIVQNMVEDGETYRNGPYYLSSVQPGKLTANPKGPAVYVGSFNHNEHSTYALIAPQFKDMAEMHRHRSFALSTRPQGDVEIDLFDRDGPRVLGIPSDSTGNDAHLFVSGTYTGKARFMYFVQTDESGKLRWTDVYNHKNGTSDLVYEDQRFHKTDFIDIAVDGKTGDMYGISENDNNVHVINPATGLSDTIEGPNSEALTALAVVRADGNIRIAVSTVSSKFYEYSQGSWSLIDAGDVSSQPDVGETAVPPVMRYVEDGTLFMHRYGDSNVYRLDGDTWVVHFEVDSSSIATSNATSFDVVRKDDGDTFVFCTSEATVYMGTLDSSLEDAPNAASSFTVIATQNDFDPDDNALKFIDTVIDAGGNIYIVSCIGNSWVIKVWRLTKDTNGAWTATRAELPGQFVSPASEDHDAFLSAASLAVVQDAVYFAEKAGGSIYCSFDIGDTWEIAKEAGTFAIGTDGLRGRFAGPYANGTWTVSTENAVGWVPSDRTGFAYKYNVGLDPHLNKHFPPTPISGAALVVNGLEMAPFELYGDDSDYMLTNTAIYWRSDKIDKLPFTIEGKNVVHSSIFHISRAPLSSSSFVTSIKAEPGSGIRIRSEGTAATANTGNLVISAQIPVVKANPGLKGYSVVKEAIGNKLIFGPVVSSVTSIDPNIQVHSRKGQPSGQGDILISSGNMMAGNFTDIVLHNAKQELIGAFPYIKLLGPDAVASGFTLKMHVPFSISPSVQYKLLFYASVFGLSDIEETEDQPFKASVGIKASVLRDWYPGLDESIDAGGITQYLRTLKDNAETAAELSGAIQIGGAQKIAYGPSQQLAYKAFDPILVHNDQDFYEKFENENSSNMAWKQCWLGIDIPAAGHLTPNSTVAIDISRSSGDANEYQGEVGFINMSWRLVEASVQE